MKKTEWQIGKAGGEGILVLFAFLVLLLLVLAVQLAHTPSYPVKFDQAQVLLLATGALADGRLPQHGILNSLRAYNPPFFVWLFIPAMAMTREPSAVLVLPGLCLHLASVLVLFHLGRRYVGPKGGLAAAAVYALSPQGLYFGHSSWAQGVTPSLYILLLSCLFPWLVEGRGWYAAVAIPLAAWIAGVHWGGALAIGTVALLPLLLRGRLRLGPVFFGVLISILIWAPYIEFERGRSFADLRALLQGPVRVPPPHELTTLCTERPTEEKPESGPGGGAGPKERIRSTSPWAYRALRAAAGMVSAVGINFHWAPLGPDLRQGTWGQMATFVVQTWLFLVGMVILLGRVRKGVSSCKAEALILLAFLVPALLQNLSPHTTLGRPDAAWLFFGPQALILSYAVASPGGIPWRMARGAAAVLLLAVLLMSSYGELEVASRSLKAPVHPQRQLVSWIARDAAAEGKGRVSIRYDLLRDRPDWCWIVSYSLVDRAYRVGAEFDYLLGLHGIENTEKAADGWARDPDYVVLFREGLRRYDRGLGMCRVEELGPYAILKVLRAAGCLEGRKGGPVS